MSKRKKHEEHEEHANHERWLVSYADMMTLLMVLFIVLFAISQVDQKKFNQLREGMAAGFGQQPSPFQGDQSVLAESGVAPMAPIAPGPVSTETKQTEQTASERQEASSDAARDAADDRERDLAEAIREVNKLDALRRKVDAALRKHGLEDDVTMRIDERGLRISLVSRHIVFAPNVADLSPRGVRVLDVIAPVLQDLPNQIEVAGHTNQVKVKPKFYPSDWELSAARAVTVLRHLKERGGVPGEHMMAAAYGHEQPLIDPSKPHSQELNKRVDILVLSTARDEVRALFDEALRAQHLT